jgi:osmotically-inducible protein OsmY
MKTPKTLAFVTLLALAAGCSYPSRQVTYSAAPTAYDYNDADRSLVTALRSEIERYGDLSEANPAIGIYAHDRIVTLTGTVATQQQRAMIDALARNQPGVASVNNQLQVSFAATGVNQPARVYAVPTATDVVPEHPAVVAGDVAAVPTVQATTAEDRQLGQEIVEALRSDGLTPNIPPTVSLTVSEARVELRGSVASEKDHQAIVSCVRRTPGVAAVYDGLHVP